MAATGIVATPTRLLAELVASSPTFQGVVAAANEAEALDHVFEVSAKGSEITRPIVIVSAPASQRFGRGGFGTGTLRMIVEQDAPAGYTRADATGTDEPDNSAGSEPFRNWIGAMIKEMLDESESGGRLLVREINQVDKLARSPAEDEGGDYFQFVYEVQFGATKA